MVYEELWLREEEEIYPISYFLSWQNRKTFHLDKMSAAHQVSEGEIHVEHWAGLGSRQIVQVPGNIDLFLKWSYM